MVWPPDPGAIGLPVQALDTPALILDLDAVERNLDRMDQALAGTNVRARPHTKTHKGPNLALEQLRRGALGDCCGQFGAARGEAAGGGGALPSHPGVVGGGENR